MNSFVHLTKLHSLIFTERCGSAVDCLSDFSETFNNSFQLTKWNDSFTGKSYLIKLGSSTCKAKTILNHIIKPYYVKKLRDFF